MTTTSLSPQDLLKQQSAVSAIEYLKSLKLERPIVGVGTGSTVNFFIDELAKIKHTIEATVSSSEASTKRLKEYHIPVIDLNSIGEGELAIYVDGADEINQSLHMIKGGGGALTREKIISAVAKEFVCIADESKLVNQLGEFPLPVEVLPMAQSYVARELSKLGGRVTLRQNFKTDNGNIILDVHGLNIVHPVDLESKINQIVGVVTNGLFAQRGANLLLLATPNGTRKIY